MYRNYLLTTLRHVLRNKYYSFINLAGLTIGLSCAIFILLFLRDELSYDAWLPGTDNLYRVEASFYFPGRGLERGATVPFPITPAMLAHIPEVRAQTHLIVERMTIKVGDRLFAEYVDVVDPSFFGVIRLPLIASDPSTVLARPDSIVLSQALAEKYFGHSDAIGKTVVLDGAHPMTVTGVMRDLPHNTQLVADAIIPNNSHADKLPLSEKDAWLNVDGEAFVDLQPQADPAIVLRKLKPILDRSIDTRKEMNLNLPGSEALQIHLTRFEDAHLTTDNYGGMKAAGSWTRIYGFATIAALILLIACFNFTNLATARATTRAREVSLRKVLGADRRQLIVQFLGESVLTAFVALILAFVVVEVLTPLYDEFVGLPLALHYLSDWPLTLLIVAVATAAGLLGGIYPALVLSAIRPAASLRMSSALQSGTGSLRMTLVIFQFAISIGLGIAALVIFTQLRYARQIDLGFDRDNLVVVTGANNLSPSARDDFARTLLQNPAILGVTQSGPVPFEHDVTISNFTVAGSEQNHLARTIDAAPDFPEVYGMKLLAGRTLSRKRGQDASTDEQHLFGSNVVITAAAARLFGFSPQQALGRTIIQDGDRMTIVGVLDDLKMDGARSRPGPIVFYFNPTHIQAMSVRVRGGAVPAALAAIDEGWRGFAPGTAIRRHFLGSMFDRLFQTDEKEGEMFALFVVVAILIACLGLLGLAAFTAERRTKEIGVRKVFGARTGDIVWLLLSQFSMPVLAANLLAWPVAWYFLTGWLESFAYRIALTPAYFLASGAVALAIAWLTVAVQAVQVARADPILALRHE
ncbi:MAG: ABC transporter permease [Rhizomicrobium sp.]